MRATGLCAALALVVAAAAGASATRVVPQTFQSVTRGEKETSVKFTRAPDTVDGAVIIAEQALDAQALDFLLPPAAQTRIDGVNFNRRFLIAVATR